MAVRTAARAQCLPERETEPRLRHQVEAGRLEGLDDAVPGGEAVAAGGPHQLRFQRQAYRTEVRRVLRLGEHRDPAAVLLRQRAGQVHDLLEGHDLLAPVEDRVAVADQGQPLHGAQGLQLGEGEVLGEPAGDGTAVHRLRGAAAGELRMTGHVRRTRDLVLVAHDQDVVLRRDEVGLDPVGPGAHRERVRGGGVFGPPAGRAPVADDERTAGPAGAAGRGRAGRGRSGSRHGGRGQENRTAPGVLGHAVSSWLWWETHQSHEGLRQGGRRLAAACTGVGRAVGGCRTPTARRGAGRDPRTGRSVRCLRVAAGRGARRAQRPGRGAPPGAAASSSSMPPDMIVRTCSVMCPAGQSHQATASSRAMSASS
ncbi:hypothetical protein EES45_23425 [Streptomyces sp. ADI97-07]|nr:hypothetical protein EES45_23425 [Streptomyces sp. ADI97-07]